MNIETQREEIRDPNGSWRTFSPTGYHLDPDEPGVRTGKQVPGEPLVTYFVLRAISGPPNRPFIVHVRRAQSNQSIEDLYANYVRVSREAYGDSFSSEWVNVSNTRIWVAHDPGGMAGFQVLAASSTGFLFEANMDGTVLSSENAVAFSNIVKDFEVISP